MQRFLFGTTYLFIPPDNFNLAVLRVDLEFEPPNKTTKKTQVLTAGQMVQFEYEGFNYSFTVNQATLKGQEASNKIPERGMLRLRHTLCSMHQMPVVSRLGIKHVKGMVLYGPPGTGKILIARQIGKMLDGREPKIVNGIEVVSKFVGETEKNVRDLLADAENDQRSLGNQSDLHIIIFDEIDAICKSRGSTRDGTGVHDSIVNQLLTKVKLLTLIAAETKNYSGAELEGVVKSATSYALNRQLHLDNLTKPVDEENIKITMSDFLHALQDMIPAFGASIDNLESCRPNDMVDCGERHDYIYKRAMLLVEQVKVSKGSKLVTCLLEGPIGRLLGYDEIGPRFSSLISQTLKVLLKRLPPKGKNLLVIGTTSEVDFLKSLGICKAFSVRCHAPSLLIDDAKKVITNFNVFAEHHIDVAAETLNEVPSANLSCIKVDGSASSTNKPMNCDGSLVTGEAGCCYLKFSLYPGMGCGASLVPE
ncbi:hypothetical protein GIB67_032790 [Kingdonia uniflora]|uniref:Vesicle-fusing ATPase n=1 Tax=Kingdonia uniflora TaxID=39325 RepID=A0A7J7MWB1_9MAGN|nr:hypothetical protein GIB67_032790 [Kingdonia uniflora]